MSDFEKWFKTTSAYRMLESMNYYKMDLFHWVEARGEYRHTSVQIAFMTWAEQQAKIDQLKAELALCREENKGLVSRVNEQHSINTALNSETIKQREQIQHYMGKCVEQNKQVEEGLGLIKSLYKSEFSQRSNPSIHISQIREIEKALRGEHENSN